MLQRPYFGLLAIWRSSRKNSQPSVCPTRYRGHTITQILHDFYCDYYSPAEKRDIMRPGAAIAGTRDI